MPEVTLTQVYKELKKIEKTMATKEELDKMLETLEILSNPDTMKQIQSSEDDIIHGRVREVNSVADV